MTRSGALARGPQPAATKRAAGVSRAPHEVRLIGGQWRRSKLPVADRPGLRPTPDRVRETLFNWLGQNLEGWRVLDAFAGSGALGFEAGSRGAAEVQLLERDPALAASLRASALRLKATTLKIDATDALSWMARAPRARWDLVLLDPPFDSELALPSLRAAAPLVVAGGYVYLEAATPFAEAELAALGLEPHRAAQAGRVHFHLFRATPAATL